MRKKYEVFWIFYQAEYSLKTIELKTLFNIYFQGIIFGGQNVSQLHELIGPALHGLFTRCALMRLGSLTCSGIVFRSESVRIGRTGRRPTLHQEKKQALKGAKGPWGNSAHTWASSSQVCSKIQNVCGISEQAFPSLLSIDYHNANVPLF